MFADLIELVLPRRCVGCGGPGTALCGDCGASRPVERYLRGVGAVHAATVYEAAVRRAVVAYKERRRRELGVPLAALLTASVRAARAGPASTGIGLVVVPSSARSRRARGFDHMTPLARMVAAGGDGLVVSALRVKRRTADTSGLGVRERQQNLSGAFAARAPAPGDDGRVLIVDDVITTGASIREAARALRLAGWRVDGAAVIAATPRRPDRVDQESITRFSSAAAPGPRPRTEITS